MRFDRQDPAPVLRASQRVELFDIVAARAETGLVRLLARHEIDRLRRLRKADDRVLFVAAHGLTRQVLGTWLDQAPEAVDVRVHCRTCGSSRHGKPFVPGGPRFSYAHANGRVLLAVTAHAPVGVDLEASDGVRFPGFDAVALTPAERSRPGWDDTTRARTWVRKEAVLKAWGHGLAIDPSELEVSAPDRAPCVISTPRPGDRPIRLVDLELPGCVGSLAVATETVLDLVSRGGVQPVRS